MVFPSLANILLAKLFRQINMVAKCKEATDANLRGSDNASGPVWMEYIAFLKSKPAASPQEESQCVTSMCKVYQKAIIKPMHHLDQLWRDYEMFENYVSRTLVHSLPLCRWKESMRMKIYFI